MTFKKEDVTFINNSDEGYLVEIRAADGSSFKRHVTDGDLSGLCEQYGFNRSEIESELGELKHVD